MRATLESMSKLVTACLVAASLAHVGTAQTVRQDGEVDPKLIAQLITSSKNRRSELLDQHPKLVTARVFMSLLSLQQKMTNDGRQATALKVSEAALQIADRIDSNRLRGLHWLMRAGTLRKLGQHRTGLDAAKKCLRLLQIDGNPGLISLAFGELAEQQEQVGAFQEALQNYRQVLEIVGQLPESTRSKPRARAYASMAELHRKLGEIEEARRCATRAIEIAERAGLGAIKASALHCLGSIEMDSGDLERAAVRFEKMLSLHREAQNRGGTMSALNSLGIVHKTLGRFPEASACIREALQMAIALKQRSLQATFLDNLGSLQRLTNQWEEGVSNHEKALAIFLEQNNSTGEAMARSHLALAYRSEGDYRRSETNFRRALEIYRRTKQPAKIAMVLNNLGNLYRVSGQKVQAIALYREALGIYERLKNPQGVIAAYFNLAHAYTGMNDTAMSRRCLEEIIKWSKVSNNRIAHARVLGIEAELLELEGREDHGEAAWELRRQALELYGDQSSEPVMMTLIELGMHWSLKPEPDLAKAKSYFERALNIASQIKNRDHQILTLIALGMVALRAEPQQPLMAKGFLDRAVKLADLGIGSELLSLAHYFAGKADAALGDYDGMIADYFASIEMQERIHGDTAAPEIALRWRMSNQRVYGYVVRHLISKNDLGRAFEYAERGRARLLHQQITEHDLMLQADLPEETRLREGKLYARLASCGLALRHEKDRDQPNQSEIAKLEREIQLIRDSIDRLILEMRSTSPVYTSIHHPQPCSLAEAERMLDSRTALLEYVLTDRGAAVFVVRQDRTRVKLLEAKRDLIADAALRFWNSMRESRTKVRSNSVFEETARQLYHQLIRPIEPMLAGIDQLIIVPDGKLHYIPFEALISDQGRDPDAGTHRSKQNKVDYLLQRFAVSYAPSATVLEQFGGIESENPAAATVLAVGDPVFPGELIKDGSPDSAKAHSRDIAQLGRLPGTAGEVKVIERLFGDRVVSLTREAATEQGFRRHCRNARIIHLGTHGVVDDRRSLFSSLMFSVPPNARKALGEVDPNDERALAGIDLTIPAGTPNDGFLQAFEVFDLHLDADLVVLSACSTGLGQAREGEGLMSLARAFAVGGARSQIFTLWNVNDSSSAALVSEFYRGLREGLSKTQALRHAKLAMLHNYDIQKGVLRGLVRTRKPAAGTKPSKRSGSRQDPLPPRYWAGFVLNGNWK